MLQSQFTVHSLYSLTQPTSPLGGSSLLSNDLQFAALNGVTRGGTGSIERRRSTCHWKVTRCSGEGAALTSTQHERHWRKGFHWSHNGWADAAEGKQHSNNVQSSVNTRASATAWVTHKFATVAFFYISFFLFSWQKHQTCLTNSTSYFQRRQKIPSERRQEGMDPFHKLRKSPRHFSVFFFFLNGSSESEPVETGGQKVATLPPRQSIGYTYEIIWYVISCRLSYLSICLPLLPVPSELSQILFAQFNKKRERAREKC